MEIDDNQDSDISDDENDTTEEPTVPDVNEASAPIEPPRADLASAIMDVEAITRNNTKGNARKKALSQIAGRVFKKDIVGDILVDEVLRATIPRFISKLRKNIQFRGSKAGSGESKFSALFFEHIFKANVLQYALDSEIPKIEGQSSRTIIKLYTWKRAIAMFGNTVLIRDHKN